LVSVFSPLFYLLVRFVGSARLFVGNFLLVRVFLPTNLLIVNPQKNNRKNNVKKERKKIPFKIKIKIVGGKTPYFSPSS
tara:strand:- start:1444 stop:1680 length:237 start_codon:yes stop_codon:yes gene_type:complete